MQPLNYWIPDPNLLQEALTHSSYANERGGALPYNERLELLGDAVVGLVVVDALFSAHPEWDEGRLTQARAGIVCEPTLAEAARRMGIGEALVLGKGEDKSGGRDKPSLLADAFEALAGAVFLAQGFDVARAFVQEALAFALQAPEGLPVGRDYKSLLLDRTRKQGVEPIYRVVDEAGPDHAKQFVVAVFSGTREMARASGHSKKEAEIEAARRALQSFPAL